MAAARAGVSQEARVDRSHGFSIGTRKRVHPQSRDMSAQSTTKGAAAQPRPGFTEPDQVKAMDAKAAETSASLT